MGRREPPKQWTQAEDARLARLYDDEALEPALIAARLGLRVGQVRTRLTKLRAVGVVKTCRGRGGRPKRSEAS